MDAYVKLLDDESLNGQAIECSVDKHIFFPDPPYLNGDVTKRAVTIWDRKSPYTPIHRNEHDTDHELKALFELMHHELSEVPGAIPGKSFPKKSS